LIIGNDRQVVGGEGSGLHGSGAGGVWSDMIGNLLPQCTYSRTMLTVIAGLLAWIAFDRVPVQTVRAQSSPPTFYKAKSVPIANIDVRPPVMFETLLNEAVEGGEIVAVAPYGGEGPHASVMVVYKSRQRR
jgi:hypothetical protein